MALDPVCLSCTKMQSDIIKKFKIACLAYAPSSVVYRNFEFTRSQILVFRKFLLGQCAKVVHLKEPYKSLGMSTKRIFDDMYLYLKQMNCNVENKDTLNQMPVHSYEEVTSKYWNLIYKDCAEEPKPGSKAQTIIELEQEFRNSELFEFGNDRLTTT